MTCDFFNKTLAVKIEIQKVIEMDQNAVIYRFLFQKFLQKSDLGKKNTKITANGPFLCLPEVQYRPPMLHRKYLAHNFFYLSKKKKEICFVKDNFSK